MIPHVVPTLVTDRLCLRQYRREDFDAFAAEYTDAEATRFTGGITERRLAWRIFASCTGQWLLSGIGWWAVELRATNEVVGSVGVFYRDGFPDLEIGWRTYRTFGGNGYAKESAQRALCFAQENLKPERVIALIDRENEPSLKVGSHLGLSYERDIELFEGVIVGRYVRSFFRT